MSMPAENTSTYKAMEALIQLGWIITELQKLLDLLEERGLITAAEHKALLDLEYDVRHVHQQDDHSP